MYAQYTLATHIIEREDFNSATKNALHVVSDCHLTSSVGNDTPTLDVCPLCWYYGPSLPCTWRVHSATFQISTIQIGRYCTVSRVKFRILTSSKIAQQHSLESTIQFSLRLMFQSLHKRFTMFVGICAIYLKFPSTYKRFKHMWIICFTTTVHAFSVETS